MSKYFKVGMVGLLVVGALAVVMAGSALAQEPTPPDPSKGPFGGWGLRGFGGKFGGNHWAMFDSIAEALDLEPEELFTKLHDGNSLADVAEAQGVEPEALHEAMQAAQIEAIQQAAEDGTLTGEQADRLIERLENMPTQEELVEAKKQAIQQAFDEGRISQEKYDWLMLGLENGYWDGRGFGGRGFHKFGGFRGMGDFDGSRGPGRLGVSGISL